MEQDVFQQRLEEDRKLVEEALHRVCQGWRRYADLTEAMEYSLLAGGKRTVSYTHLTLPTIA